MQSKSIGRFSAEQIAEARARYAQTPKREIADVSAAMKTADGRQRVAASIERVIKAHKHALSILKDR